ncbi:MAG: hypothetical protein NVSMB38_29060 [Ktedonobacteraceae bacterium]
MKSHDLAVGQQQARTRWGTHTSGAVFDRKKTSYLTDQAQQFIAQQALCVISGLDLHNELSGLLALGMPGFVEPLGEHQCLLQLDGSLAETRLLQHLYQAPACSTHLGLFFICHATRQRLCLQGTAELLPHVPIDQSLYAFLRKLVWDETSAAPARLPSSIRVRIHVEQVFFHCPKYIKTCIPGLTSVAGDVPTQKWWSAHLPRSSQSFLSEEGRTFLAKQVLCYLCTADQKGHCAVNHRGGAPGFLVSLPPETLALGGIILVPDYAGNGAFEAIGNIFETGQAALVVPDYVDQVALCISGPAFVLERTELASEVAERCPAAERVIALSIQRVEVQHGNWSAPLAHEQARAHALFTRSHSGMACPI